MKGARLQLRIEASLRRRAQGVAARRGQTLSAIITKFLQDLVSADLTERRAGAAIPDEVEQI